MDYNNIPISFGFYQWKDIYQALSEEIVRCQRHGTPTASMEAYQLGLEKALKDIAQHLRQP